MTEASADTIREIQEIRRKAHDDLNSIMAYRKLNIILSFCHKADIKCIFFDKLKNPTISMSLYPRARERFLEMFFKPAHFKVINK